MSRFTLDSATEFLFGHCVDSLSAGLPYPHNVISPNQGYVRDKSEDFAIAFADCQEAIANRSMVGWAWPLLEIQKDKSEESMRVVNAYLDPIIQDAVKKFKDSGKSKAEDLDENDNLLDHLVNHTSGEI